MRQALSVVALTLLSSAPALAASPGPTTAPAAQVAAAPSPGRSAFDRWCAECHAAGVGHPGTQQLERIRGSKLALLEARTDLEPAYIRYVVRHGQNAMPAYRPSEITDADLEAIAQHLGRKAAPAKTRKRP